MRISNVLDKGKIKVFLRGTTKGEVIEELVDLLLQDCPAELRASVRQEVLAREAECSTGIGEEVAIPHARTDSCSELMLAFGLSQRPIDFDSIDHKPVRIVLLILCPGSLPGLQLRVLARASRLLNNPDLRARLLSATDADAVHEAFQQYEGKHFG